METKDAIVILVLSVGFFFFIDWIRTRSRRRKEKQLTAEFKQTYDKFVAGHAELYEKVATPLDDNDKRSINTYHNWVIVILLPFTAGFFALMYYSSPSELEDYIAAGCFGLIVTVGYIWSFYNRKKLLASNEKMIIKGVITNKRTTEEDDSKTYYITISDKDAVTVSKSDYNKFNHGDIIQLEVLGPLTSMLKYKISLLGKLQPK